MRVKKLADEVDKFVARYRKNEKEGPHECDDYGFVRELEVANGVEEIRTILEKGGARLMSCDVCHAENPEMVVRSDKRGENVCRDCVGKMAEMLKGTQ